jgi:hypothetical protein
VNLYTFLGYGVGTSEAAALSERLAAWHDPMVSHERRLRRERAGEVCDEDCPHGAAPELWAKAVTTFGARADELSFLRARAIYATRGSDDDAHDREEAKPAIDDRRSDRSTPRTDGGRRRSLSVRPELVASRTGTGEW